MPPDPYVRTLVEHAAEAPGTRPTGASPAASVGWPLDRMAVVDRIVLRLAVAELLDPDGPPPAVVIDEAVELAKEYSTDESGRFVNGILSTIAADIGPRSRRAPGPGRRPAAPARRVDALTVK